MTAEADGVATLLARAYGIAPVALSLLRRVPEKVVYRVDRADHPPWLVRIGAATTAPDTYAADAATLVFLEQHRYPARPRRAGRRWRCRADARGAPCPHHHVCYW